MRTRRLGIALALLAGLSWTSLAPVRAATDPGGDPLAQYVVLIEKVRGDLTTSLTFYLANDRAKARRLTRLAEA